MFPWLTKAFRFDGAATPDDRRKRRTTKSAFWTRRTRWTPLLLSQREFQRTLSKERSRADRTQVPFGFIVLRFANHDAIQRDTVSMAKILHRRLRDTDEKGHLGIGRLGIVLPATDADGTQFVLADILMHAKLAHLEIDAEWFVYPDQFNSPDQTSQEASDKSEKDSVGAPYAYFVNPSPSWKRGLDILGAITGLVLTSPLLVMSSLLILGTSRGGVFFRQERTGYLGRNFTIYKLRTMVQDAEILKADLVERNERDGPAFKIDNDPRVTWVGRFLRNTGIDELPQLYNVLIGDMSLVGPRPLPVYEQAKCQPWQQRRLDVKPGITCFWQLTKSSAMPFSEWMRLDRDYARRISLWLDLKLIAKTFHVALTGRVGR